MSAKAIPNCLLILFLFRRSPMQPLETLRLRQPFLRREFKERSSHAKPKDTTPIGEGNYDAAAAFDEAEAKFVKSGNVKAKAREAADALDTPEGKELEKARRETAKGHPKH